jgi:hypothetical protein
MLGTAHVHFLRRLENLGVTQFRKTIRANILYCLLKMFNDGVMEEKGNCPARSYDGQLE